MPQQLALLIQTRTPLIWLDTPEERRAERLIAEAAERTGDGVQCWSLTHGWHPPGRPARSDGDTEDPRAALAVARAHGRRAVWVMHDIGALTDDPAVTRAIKDTARAVSAVDGVLICVGDGFKVPPSLAADAQGHRLALPEREEHAAQLRRIAESSGERLHPERARRLARACLGLTLEQSEHVWLRARARGGRFTEEDVPWVLNEKAHLARAVSGIEFIPGVSLDRLAGFEVVKSWIRERQFAFSERAQRQGLPFPRGLLLVGIPGCGKSMVARALAGTWGQPLMRLDMALITDERGIRSALSLAERASPCVLWLQGIERIGQRTDAPLFAPLLNWMEEKRSPVFIIATADGVDALPHQLLRRGRFDEAFFIDLPGSAQREAIWLLQITERAELSRDETLLERLDVGALARLSDGYNGAEIVAALDEASLTAMAEDRPLEWGHVVDALSASPPLSGIAKGELKALREWAIGRARPAT